MFIDISHDYRPPISIEQWNVAYGIGLTAVHNLMINSDLSQQNSSWYKFSIPMPGHPVAKNGKELEYNDSGISTSFLFIFVMRAMLKEHVFL